MKAKLASAIEYFSGATAACLVTMVKGHLLSLDAGHLLIASQTGVLAGVATFTAIVVLKIENRWFIALTLGLLTAAADYIVHPEMFGSSATEALITGLGAALLSYPIAALVRTIQQAKNA